MDLQEGEVVVMVVMVTVVVVVVVVATVPVVAAKNVGSSTKTISSKQFYM